jgi:hypothetical protein
MSQLFNLCSDCGDLPLRDRLNYLLGQVLGVSEFQQEQTYFLHKSRLHNRSLHGYGTVWGLAVSHGGTGDELRLQVAPGLVIDAQGRKIWVDALQCAALNTWLNAAIAPGSTTLNRETLQRVTAGGSVLALYVTLGYRTCETGLQPILGDPCRADLVAGDKQGVLQYTRLRDDFQLNLQALPPRHPEEARIRAIGDLWSILVVDPTAAALSEADRETLLQSLREAIDDPTRIAGLGTVTLPQVQSRDLLRELLNYWITQTRPNLDRLSHPIVQLLTKIENDPDPAAIALDAAAFDAQMQIFSDAFDGYVNTQTLDAIAALPVVTVAPTTATALRRAVLELGSSQPLPTSTAEDDVVLLAEVRFGLTAANGVDEATLEILDLSRPSLVQTRLLQELLLQSVLQRTGTVGSALTIAIGTVTTVAPDALATVTISGDATNPVLNFWIPQGQPGVSSGGVAPLILSPSDLILPNPPQQFPAELNFPADLPPAVLGSVTSYPSLIFSPQEDGTTTGFAAFSALHPNTSAEFPPSLTLYYTAIAGNVQWMIAWRWVRSLRPDEALRPDAILGADQFDSAILPRVSLQGFQLQQSEPLSLPVTIDDADFLLVYLVPNAQIGGEDRQLYLLSANLRWAS